MLQTVKDACQPHHDAIDFSMADHIENLHEVINEAQDGRAFFEQTFITEGMDQLFRQGLKRLAGQSDDAVFQLTQAMGGGKTHLLVALGLLAKNPDLRTRIVPELATQLPFDSADVVAFSGRNYPDHFFWGEIAHQLGKQEIFSKYWANGPRAPDENAWIELIGDVPVLILLDELPPYFDNALTIPVGGGTLANVATAALANLMSAALKLPRLCVVMSNLSGSYDKASKQLGKALGNVVSEANRQARPITPVQLGGNEIYAILRKRLFKQLPDEQTIDRIADAYANAITEAEKSKSIGKSSEQIAAEIHGSYPFHPGLKDVIAMFKENESFRQTRGLMRFVARILKSVWEQSENDVYLIGAQHLNMNHPDVRDEILTISSLHSAVAKDIADSGNAHAELIDASTGNDAASQVARLLMTASLSKSLEGRRGLDKQRLLEYLIAPHHDPLSFTDAFDALRKSAWYLHPGERGSYYFSDQENLTKRLEKEAEHAPENKIDEEMRRRLHEMFEPKSKNAYEQAIALPKLDQVNLKQGRLLLILSPDDKMPPEEAERLFDHVTEKNNFCIIAGDGSDLASLESTVRRVWAVAKVDKELPVNHPQKEELRDKGEEAELEFRSTAMATFNHLLFPGRKGLTPTKFDIRFSNNAWNGEAQIERSLADTNALKLVTDVSGEADKLMPRAEDQLWPKGQHRVRWVDIVDRAKTNPRWLWLPPKGLELLRRTAEAQGLWRYSDDGYIDKNPEKAKTTVVVSETHYDEATGKATLRISTQDAGQNPVIHMAETANVTTLSPVLSELTLTTDQTRLYFLAVDPTGTHQTGAVEVWQNKLTITHQPHVQGTTRQVELRVVPRGEIRYSIDGTNPRQGQLYNTPFTIGAAETMIRVLASEGDVEANREFRIPPLGQKGPALDETQPARLSSGQQKEKLSFSGSAEVYTALKQAQQLDARLHGVQINVGQGDKHGRLRFGSGCELSAESTQTLVASLRAALTDEQAPIELILTAMTFPCGFDLHKFSQAVKLDLETCETINIEGINVADMQPSRTTAGVSASDDAASEVQT